MSQVDVQRILQSAEALRQSGRVADAIALLQPLAVSHADTPGVLHVLGILLAVSKRHDEAATTLARATAVEPTSADLWNNYGAVLLVSGRADDAVAPLERALTLRPDYADAKRNLAAALYRTGDAAATAGDLPRAASALSRSLELRPDHAATIARLASVHRLQGDADTAIALFERAHQLDPTSAAILNNLAEALLFAGRADDADERLRRALALDPNHVEAHVTLGCARLRQAKIDEAIEQFEQALRLSPQSPRAHEFLGTALLQRGHFQRGWREYEWRFQTPEMLRSKNIYHRVPAWRGEPLAGRTIFLHAEQGFGDAIQFARYVPMVVDRTRGQGGRVILGCRPELRRLFASIAGVDAIVESGHALPSSIDFQCPLMSLPMAFGTTIQTIPNTVPYLAAPAERFDAWRQRVAGDGAAESLRVGLTWAGNPALARDRVRSAALRDLAPLADVPGVTFYSLQPGGSADVAGSRGPRLIDHTAHLTDWSETAAFVANLDLVISVDTAVAHLAGALARPTWTLLPAAGEWRWLIGRADSPWYPTMRLFRQQNAGDWAGVMREVAACLFKLSESSGARSQRPHPPI